MAEGWLEQAQARLLGKRIVSRFELLLAFGYDCAGAVSVIDPDPTKLSQILIDPQDPRELAVLTSRASLSGVQPKLALIEQGGKYIPAKMNELSTHIAKFPSQSHNDLVVNEFLTTQAFKALLPDDNVVTLFIGTIEGFTEPALILKRFDRHHGMRLHFEEFNQLLQKSSREKYEGSYKDMADFIQKTPGCLPVEIYRLYLRILAGVLLGNTDMHFKNFAMFHTSQGFRLTPSYDQVAATLYHYKNLALSLGGSGDLPLATLKPKHIIRLGEEFFLSKAAINMAMKHLKHHKDSAKEAISQSEIGNPRLKDSLINLMEARWKGTFDLIGQHLSKKR